MLGAMDAAIDGVAMLHAMADEAQPQCGQTGASAAMAHSNESNTSVRPPMVTSQRQVFASRADAVAWLAAEATAHGFVYEPPV